MTQRDAMFDLTGRVAIVTGVGAALAVAFPRASRPWRQVVMTGRNEATLAEAATEIRAKGGEASGTPPISPTNRT